jgi:hypothetical protein
MEIHKAGFPSLSTSEYPDTVLDTRAFSPLVEMLNGLIWRLTCDSVLATGSTEACHILSTFLAQGETAITPTSYFGTIIPGRFYPSFSYHFTVGDRWPTRLNPLKDLIKAPFVSERVLDFDPLVIDLYMDHHPQLVLITKDEKSTDAHKSRTPESTYVPLPPARTATASPMAPAQVSDSRSQLSRLPYNPPDQFGFIPVYRHLFLETCLEGGQLSLLSCSSILLRPLSHRA